MSDLIERLNAVEGSDEGTHWYRNPDGPEAAARIAELEAEVARLTAERDVARRAIGEDDSLDAFGYLTLLRGEGWRVAVHNDYRLHGRDWTFWLFTHPSGRWIKGEGVSDGLALAQAHDAALAAPDTGGAADGE